MWNHEDQLKTSRNAIELKRPVKYRNKKDLRTQLGSRKGQAKTKDETKHRRTGPNPRVIPRGAGNGNQNPNQKRRDLTAPILAKARKKEKGS